MKTWAVMSACFIALMLFEKPIAAQPIPLGIFFAPQSSSGSGGGGGGGGACNQAGQLLFNLNCTTVYYPQVLL